MFVNLVGYRPSPRYDELSWDRASIEEAPDAPTAPLAAGTEIEVKILVADVNPAAPAARNFTTELASAPPRWYRVIFYRNAAPLVLDESDWRYYDPAAGGYPNVVELVSGSSVSELTSKTLEQQEALRTIAISNVERFTGQVFEATTETLVMDGQGADSINLPKRAEEITGVTVKGTDYDLTSVALSEDGDRIYFRALSTGYAVEAMRETAIDSRTFRAGPGTVVIEGTFGWSTCPDAVAEAIRIEMEAEALAEENPLKGTVTTARRLGLTDIAQGNLRATLGDPALVSPEAARLLRTFVWTGPGGYIV